MKFFKQKQTTTVRTVDPRSKKFVESANALLEKHGITDGVKKAKCAVAMFRQGLKFARKLQSALAKKQPTDKVIDGCAPEMCALLAQYGITSPEEQEDIIIEFFSSLTGLAS